MSSQEKLSRRRLLGMGAVVATAAVLKPLNVAAQRWLRTPAQTAGPFYPQHPQQDKDLDLTQIEGRAERAQGDIIEVIGTVRNENGAEIAGAMVEIWQANAKGRYRHKRDPNPAPLDPNFQGWGQVVSGSDGAYGFKTIMPGAYPANRDWMRPPHIHFKVARRGYVELVTQMYFPENKLNSSDLILQSLTTSQQSRVIARKNSNRGDKAIARFEFDIVLISSG